MYRPPTQAIHVVDDLDSMRSLLKRYASEFTGNATFRVPRSRGDGYSEVSCNQLPGSLRARIKVLLQRQRRAKLRAATRPVGITAMADTPMGRLKARMIEANARNVPAKGYEQSGADRAARELDDLRDPGRTFHVTGGTPAPVVGVDVTTVTPAIEVLRSTEVERCRRTRSSCGHCGHSWQPRNASRSLNRCPACGTRGLVRHVEVA